MKRLLILIGFIFANFLLCAQEIDVGEAEMELITIKEWNILAVLNSSGVGVGFQHGKTPNYRDKHLWEVEFSYCMHHKAVRGRIYTQGRSFSYGKLYDLFFLRGGYGYQHIITHKPYYGGVQIRYFIGGGASICFGLPTYLEVFKTNANNEDYLVVERYHPDSTYRVFGGARFFDRFKGIAVRPGFYVKTGVNFDFSNNPLKMQLLEVGLSVDMVFPFIQQMAT